MIYDSVPPPPLNIGPKPEMDKRDIRLVDIAKRIDRSVLDDIEVLMNGMARCSECCDYADEITRVRGWLKSMRGFLEREGWR